MKSSYPINQHDIAKLYWARHQPWESLSEDMCQTGEGKLKMHLLIQSKYHADEASLNLL